jgi:hypothetical protein
MNIDGTGDMGIAPDIGGIVPAGWFQALTQRRHVTELIDGALSADQQPVNIHCQTHRARKTEEMRVQCTARFRTGNDQPPGLVGGNKQRDAELA